MAIVKNEARNISEWIDHYFWQGAAHLFIIDNGSGDSTVEIIKSHPRRSDITIYMLPRPYRQVEHYRHVFLKEAISSRFQWLIIADADEFWFDKEGEGLPAALQSREAFDLIYCNWTIFGTSGLEVHPTSLRKELTKCQPKLGPHEFTKWAVKTDAIRGRSAITVHKVAGCRSTHTISDNERFQINHYFTQSLEFWRDVKMRRGDVVDPANDAARTLQMYHGTEAACVHQDDKLSSMVKAL
ncbi:MAG: glycosyltransferase family 2 protein [Pseudomonadota bacterium]